MLLEVVQLPNIIALFNFSMPIVMDGFQVLNKYTIKAVT